MRLSILEQINGDKRSISKPRILYFKNWDRIRFWEDIWLGRVSLKYQYPSLFNIVRKKHVTVAEVLSPNPLNISFRSWVKQGSLPLWQEQPVFHGLFGSQEMMQYFLNERIGFDFGPSCSIVKNWLRYLNLSHCPEVGSIPEVLCGLQELQFLDLSSCTELQQFPHLLNSLTNLEDLNLSGCSNLKKLPESLGRLYYLRSLNLSGCCELEQLPEYFLGLVNLQYLNLVHVLRELPESPSKLERLHTLDITGYRPSPKIFRSIRVD
ncbi:hypothetical protein U9M48_007901, partial [Paspalum notatum var. saurae]